MIGMKYIQNVSELTRPKVDYPSILLSTLGFGGLVYSFSASGDLGWSDAKVYAHFTCWAYLIMYFCLSTIEN